VCEHEKENRNWLKGAFRREEKRKEKQCKETGAWKNTVSNRMLKAARVVIKNKERKEKHGEKR
jgi:hypothetical protein